MSVTSPALPCDIPQRPHLPLENRGGIKPLRTAGELGRDAALPAGRGRDSPGRDLEGKRRHRDQLPGAAEGQAGPGWGWPAAGCS